MRRVRSACGPIAVGRAAAAGSRAGKIAKMVPLRAELDWESNRTAVLGDAVRLSDLANATYQRHDL